VSYLCVPIFVHTLEQARGDLAAAVAAGAEMIELRLDAMDDRRGWEELLLERPVPLIVTCRSQAEGGLYRGSEENRLNLLQAAAASGACYVDVELAAGREIAAESLLILSSHDFAGRPRRLHNLLLEMDQIGCDVKKIAWTARSIRDNLEAFEILQRQSKPTIALCMGQAGVISRILAKKFGAFLTFASLDEQSATADGQISIGQMKGLYRWDKINRKTKIHGVVAHPVGHSLSPAVHNAGFNAVGYDGLYVPLLVNPGYESFKAFMETFVPFEGLDLCGLSITLPHKENALRYLKEKGAEVEDLAAHIGAVNTIAIDRGGPRPQLRGFNTDYAAILDSITTARRCERRDLAGMTVGVLGAGGTARTAVAALTGCKAKVIIFNRTLAKAKPLADEFAAGVLPLADAASSGCQILINATSVGMHPNIDKSPIGGFPPQLGGELLVFDTIYNPMKTKLLREAEAAGAKVAGGVEMFVRQAAAQFTAWTGQAAPLEAMRSVVQRQLNRG
jgi:3-dehydroquinate dehydratase / shikimate dehydrogenase